MKNSHAICFLLITFVLSVLDCKNEPSQGGQETGQHQTAPLDTKGKVAGISETEISIGEGSPIALPSKDDKNVATIFFVRHAEHVEGKTMLAPEGQGRAGWLAMVFAKTSKLDQAYAVNNPSLQTGLPTARANECSLNIYQPDDPAAFLKTILPNAKGKRTLIVSTADLIPAYLNLLTGTQSFQEIPAGEYDNLYVAFVQDVGKAEVKQLKY
jgi:hypothetical protein